MNVGPIVDIISDNRPIFLLIDDLSKLPENLNNISVIQQFHYPDNST